ncbi:hypothetical protein AQJ27_04960 [Streptomyces olivochromogenes]|nr:hypothetical protein AQJ27_04960 [Streptomyces olivochromogenes]
MGGIVKYGVQSGAQPPGVDWPNRTLTPAPASVTCPATTGWSSRMGATTRGTACQRASHMVLL